MREITTTAPGALGEGAIVLPPAPAVTDRRAGFSGVLDRAREELAQFFAVTGLYADLDAPFEKFEPSDWLSPGYAAAIAYRTDPSTPATDHPYVLATYIEGDVTRYRFARHEDAARAGRLWAVGTPAGAA